MIKVIIAFSFFFSGCVSPQPKTAVPLKSVCDSELYKGPDYNPINLKESVNKFNDGEEVYLQTQVQKCEQSFDEGTGLECGIQKSITLVWEGNNKTPLDRVNLFESGCEPTNSPMLRVEPWAPNEVRVKKDLAIVEYYWNYYSRNQQDECMIRVFKMDRNKMKFQELPEVKCR